jgi:hypothetical protein
MVLGGGGGSWLLTSVLPHRTLHHSDYRNAHFCCCSNLTCSRTFAESPPPSTQSIYAHVPLFLAFVLDCSTLKKGIGMLFQNVGNLLLACPIQHPK